MKKLIVAAAIICAAAFAQAGTVKWQSGTLYTAADANGGWSTTTAMSASQLITMSIFLVDDATYTSVSAMDMKGIYDWTSGKTADYSGTNFNGTKYIGAVTISDTNGVANKFYNSIMVATYTDSNSGVDFYIASAESKQATSAGAASFTNMVSGPGASTGWAANVPEPTSGLLLLLGMAGLALKRKVA